MRALGLRLSLVALFLPLGGCSDYDDLPPCEQKFIACQNSCFKSGAGSACTSCCNEAQGACTRGENYSFFWCPGKE